MSENGFILFSCYNLSYFLLWKSSTQILNATSTVSHINWKRHNIYSIQLFLGIAAISQLRNQLNVYKNVFCFRNCSTFVFWRPFCELNPLSSIFIIQPIISWSFRIFCLENCPNWFNLSRSTASKWVCFDCIQEKVFDVK